MSEVKGYYVESEYGSKDDFPKGRLRLEVTNIPELKELLKQAENEMNQLNETIKKIHNFYLEVDVFVKDAI